MQAKIRYELTAHAETVMAERKIQAEWVNRVLQSPGRTEPDKFDPELRHALGRIGEQDDRILRVVYNVAVNPWRVVTVYFDRAQRGKL